MSDWEQRPLSQAQLEYAALDAWVLLSLFCTLSAHELGSLTPCSLGCETRSVSPADISAPPPGQQPHQHPHFKQEGGEEEEKKEKPAAPEPPTADRPELTKVKMKVMCVCVCVCVCMMFLHSMLGALDQVV
jgi:hypothetical protein